FDPYVHAAPSRVEGGANSRLTRRVHDVYVRAEQFSKGAEMMDAVRFDNGRAGTAVPLRAGLSVREQRVLQRVDRVGIFAMRGHNDTELFRELHGRKQILIGEVQGRFVREEYFEGRDAGVYDVAKL